MSNDKWFYKKSKNLALISMLLAGVSKLFALCSKLFAKNSLFIALCFMLWVGCASFKEYKEPRDITHGQITIYLNGPEKTSTDITFELTNIKILTEDGLSKEIFDAPLKVNAREVIDRQLFLTERYIPEGRYKKLIFSFSKASLISKERISSLAIPPEGLELDIDITITRNQNTSLFLSWIPDSSIVDGYLFKPLFHAKGQVPELSSLLVYVTNEDSNNVSVINRQTDSVVATVLVGKGPKGIAASSLKERPKVYVVNSESNSISIIDPTTNKIEIEIPIRFGRKPEAITVAKISPERELIFVTNYGSDNVSVIDSLSYQEIDKINVGSGPIAVATDSLFNSFSSSKYLTFGDINLLKNYQEKFFNVYVANKNSRDVSVIKINKISLTVEEVINLKVDWSPVAIEVDGQRGKVYVANYNSENLSVIDFIQLIKGNTRDALSTITNVGNSITGIVTDRDIDRIYLLKELNNEILVVRLFSEAFKPFSTTMVMSPVIDTIPVGSSPRALIMDPEGRKLYVVNRGSNNVSVIDKVTKRQEKVIPVGKKPYGITMFPF